MPKNLSSITQIKQYIYSKKKKQIENSSLKQVTNFE